MVSWSNKCGGNYIWDVHPNQCLLKARQKSLMLFLKHFEGKKKVLSLWSYSPMLALHAAGINNASDICICIDFNKRNFIHASYCTCAIITWGYQHSKCTLPRSHRRWLRVSLGKLNTKNLIKIIIKSPLVWSSGATDTALQLHLIC